MDEGNGTEQKEMESHMMVDMEWMVTPPARRTVRLDRCCRFHMHRMVICYGVKENVVS